MAPGAWQLVIEAINPTAAVPPSCTWYQVYGASVTLMELLDNSSNSSCPAVMLIVVAAAVAAACVCRGVRGTQPKHLRGYRTLKCCQYSLYLQLFSPKALSFTPHDWEHLCRCWLLFLRVQCAEHEQLLTLTRDVNTLPQRCRRLGQHASRRPATVQAAGEAPLCVFACITASQYQTRREP